MFYFSYSVINCTIRLIFVYAWISVRSLFNLSIEAFIDPPSFYKCLSFSWKVLALLSSIIVVLFLRYL